MPSVTVDEWVLATYNEIGQEPLLIKFNSGIYRLRPGIPTPIPRPAANLWFGDPDCQMGKATVRRDQDGAVTSTVVPREVEVRRLRQKWGLPFGDERTFLNSDGELGVPDVTLKSLDGETEYLTILQDPLGNGGGRPGLAVPGGTDFERLQYLAEQMEILRERMETANAATDADLESTDLPVDLALLPEDNAHAKVSSVTPASDSDDDPAPLFGGILEDE